MFSQMSLFFHFLIINLFYLTRSYPYPCNIVATVADMCGTSTLIICRHEHIRDRPFNLKGGGGGGYGFLFRSEIFLRTTRELKYLLFLSRKARNFFPDFNIRLYHKNCIRLFFFPPPKSEYFFQQHWESEYYFRKKP